MKTTNSVLIDETRDESGVPCLVFVEVGGEGERIVTEQATTPEHLDRRMDACTGSSKAPRERGLAFRDPVFTDGPNDGALDNGQADWQALSGALKQPRTLQEFDALRWPREVTGPSVYGKHGQARTALKHVEMMTQRPVGRAKCVLQFSIAQPRVGFERAEDPPPQRMRSVVHRAAS